MEDREEVVYWDDFAEWGGRYDSGCRARVCVGAGFVEGLWWMEMAEGMEVVVVMHW